MSVKRRGIDSMGKAGVGIRGMQERVRQLGGTFQIGTQSDGSGTIIIARLPVDGASVSSSA